ncbi:uncharacterized protein LOC141644121 [Silene latifolia]|uniref:uncharacterized protein LOC141644121 n=1 Tax=Silene latifolia TaxID=37657 RepID=UPI003D77CD8E
MAIFIFPSIISCNLTSWHRTLLVYAGIWTSLLCITVAIAALSPEVSFIWAISPTSSFSLACGSFLRVPVDLPLDVVCLPATLFQRSKLDMVVPPIFAALVVASSACLVRFVGL